MVLGRPKSNGSKPSAIGLWYGGGCSRVILPVANGEHSEREAHVTCRKTALADFACATGNEWLSLQKNAVPELISATQDIHTCPRKGWTSGVFGAP